MITQIPSDKFVEMIEQEKDLSNLTGHAIRGLLQNRTSVTQATDKKKPAALVFFKKEPTVPQWNYFRDHILQVIADCKELDLEVELTPCYENIIKSIKKDNREHAKTMRKLAKLEQKRLDERDIPYRPDLFDYGDSFDKDKGDFIA